MKTTSVLLNQIWLTVEAWTQWTLCLYGSCSWVVSVSVGIIILTPEYSCNHQQDDYVCMCLFSSWLLLLFVAIACNMRHLNMLVVPIFIKVVGSKQFSYCKVDCCIHHCTKPWDCLSWSSSWSNMQLFITILVAINMQSCSAWSQSRDRAIVHGDLHFNERWSFAHSRAIKLVIVHCYLHANECWSFAHSCAIKLLCSFDTIEWKQLIINSLLC